MVRFFMTIMGGVTEPDATDAEIQSEITSNLEGAYSSAEVATLAISEAEMRAIKEGLIRLIVGQ